MALQCPSPVICFPLGLQGGARVDAELACAVASEAAIRLQQEDVEGLENIYEHISLAPRLRAEATRQIGVAFSLSRLFRRDEDFRAALDPAPEAVERIAAHFERIARHAPSVERAQGLAPSYVHEAARMRAQGHASSIASYLNMTASDALRAGDIAAALECLKLSRQSGVEIDDPMLMIEFAGHWSRLGCHEQASLLMAGVFSGMRGAASLDDLDTLLIASARSYLRIGALDGAGILIETLNDGEIRFFMLIEKADALMKFRYAEEARHCLLNDCLQEARAVEDRTTRIGRFQAIIDTLIEYGLKDDATAILANITDHLSNRDDGDRDRLVWAAKAMRNLDFPVADIVGWLSDGWLFEDHPDFRDDPTGIARRQSQAYFVRERWRGELDDIADALLTA